MFCIVAICAVPKNFCYAISEPEKVGRKRSPAFWCLAIHSSLRFQMPDFYILSWIYLFRLVSIEVILLWL